MNPRPFYLERIQTALRRSRGAVLLGPRQCGKTTLARALISDYDSPTYLDLEDPEHLARLANPRLVLEACRGLVVIDEVQHRPDLFAVLRVLMDRQMRPAQFLLLGSASPALVESASESLAGRVEFIEMAGFHLSEVGSSEQERLWLRGQLPPAFLAASADDCEAWRRSYLQALAQRDLRSLGITLPPQQIRRFLSMVAHYHGQTWNSSEIAASMQIAHTTSRRYLDLLTGAFLVRQLQPWFENIAKRQVKSPKVYMRDTGLLHHFLRVETRAHLEGHPKLGASWEGFAMEQLLQRAPFLDAYFWATHGGADLDVLLVGGGKKWGVEIKYTERPRTTRSIRSAMKTLGLEEIVVVSPVREAFPLDDAISVKPLDMACEWIQRL